jgi:hypothetical protein
MDGRVKLLVRNERRFPVSGSTNLIFLRTAGYSFAGLNPASEREQIIAGENLKI